MKCRFRIVLMRNIGQHNLDWGGAINSKPKVSKLEQQHVGEDEERTDWGGSKPGKIQSVRGTIWSQCCP